MGRMKPRPRLAVVPPIAGGQETPEQMAEKALKGIQALQHKAFEAGFKAGFERGFTEGAKGALGFSPSAQVIDPKKKKAKATNGAS